MLFALGSALGAFGAFRYVTPATLLRRITNQPPISASMAQPRTQPMTMPLTAPAFKAVRPAALCGDAGGNGGGGGDGNGGGDGGSDATWMPETASPLMLLSSCEKSPLLATWFILSTTADKLGPLDPTCGGFTPTSTAVELEVNPLM